ncbi:hypothetical protein BDZ91DRAFT_760386 [Kalaharituber pfeilii]|nr:hypothetical protein BDZ91DRAFT_760386 [Kalaharituber pfeilii]
MLSIVTSQANSSFRDVDRAMNIAKSLATGRVWVAPKATRDQRETEEGHEGHWQHRAGSGMDQEIWRHRGTKGQNWGLLTVQEDYLMVEGIPQHVRRERRDSRHGLVDFQAMERVGDRGLQGLTYLLTGERPWRIRLGERAGGDRIKEFMEAMGMVTEALH